MPDRITLSEFETVAASCTRWQPRSLEAVRMLLVDGKAMTEVAKIHKMSIAQLSTSRTRFMGKLAEHRLSEFRINVKPKGTPNNTPALQKMAIELGQLQDDGYTIEQIIEYLESHDIKATAAEISKVLQGAKL